MNMGIWNVEYNMGKINADHLQCNMKILNVAVLLTIVNVWKVIHCYPPISPQAVLLTIVNVWIILELCGYICL